MAASSISPDRGIESPPTRVDSRRSWAAPFVPRRGRDALHLAVLCAFAVAEPLFEMLDTRPAALADQGLVTLFLLSVVLIAGIPLPLIAMEELAGRISLRLRDWVHILLVSVLLTLFSWPLLKQTHAVPGIYLIPLGVVVGLLGGAVYATSVWAQRLVSAASPGMLLFPVAFLCQSPHWIPAPAPPPSLEVRNPTPVMLIVFDEFCGTSLMGPDRQIDAVRYPHFAELARGSTWHRNATSVHPVTTNAVPAILDGRYPRQDLMPTLEAHPQNLFSLLKATGKFELAVFEPYTRLLPPDPRARARGARSALGEFCEILPLLPIVFVHALFPSDVPFERPDIPRLWFGLRSSWEVDRNQRRGLVRYPWDSDRNQQLEHFGDCLTRGDQPALYFMHCALPHVPWCYLPSGRRYRPDGGPSFGTYAMGTVGLKEEMWQTDPLAADQGWQRYLMQLQWLDRELGRLIAQLKKSGLYDETLIIVTADHGISFRAAHSRRQIDDETLPDIASVPLFVKAPHQQEGKIDDGNAEAIDVLPTILDLLGIEPPEPVDGTSLLADDRVQRPRKELYEVGMVHPLDAAFSRRDETLLNMLDRFGSGGDDDRLFRLGPHPELLGRDVADFTAAPHPVRWRFEVAPFGDSPPAARTGLLPCYLEGRVLSRVDQPLQIAVAVNGVIGCVTRTYFSAGMNHKWTAMLPESALRVPAPELRFYVISEVRGETILEDCTPSDPQLAPQ
ncbi:MAG TPA: sulfatase-like hydrolase/transferase [Planctomycetaceae bacterium]|nr:sulfatase-like hydrolase/transferase [Planctomycetaceae bacterium]